MNIKKNASAKRVIIFLSIIILFLLLILLYPLVFKSDFERYEEKYKYSKGLPYQVYKFLYLDTEKNNKESFWNEVDLGKYYALIISNNRYRLLPNLENAENDGNKIAAILSQQYNFEVNHLKNASEDQIYNAFSVLKKLDKNTNILIYYSGHGKIDTEANTGYWLPIDAHNERKSKWISDEDIKAELRTFNAKHILVIADSCFSGTILKREIEQFDTENFIELSMLSELAKIKTRLAITSGGESPVIDKKGNSEHSVFAKELIQILKENEDVILASQLYKTIKSRLHLNEKQKPQFDFITDTGSHTGGDFIFLKRKK
jgi:hypothetical protein